MRERLMIGLQRLYWVLLGLILFAFGLVNRDLLATPKEFDLVFGRFNIKPIWLVIAFVVAFLIQILLSWAVSGALQKQTARVEQELAQTKAALYDRGQRQEGEEQGKPKA